jgi:hypothetical protein
MTPEKAKIWTQFAFQLADLFAEKLAECVEPEKPIEKVLLQKTNIEKRIIDKKELAARFGVSTRTISNLQNEGLPTINRFGSRVLFDFEDVLMWAKDKKIKGRRKTNCVCSKINARETLSNGKF